MCGGKTQLHQSQRHAVVQQAHHQKVLRGGLGAQVQQSTPLIAVDPKEECECVSVWSGTRRSAESSTAENQDSSAQVKVVGSSLEQELRKVRSQRKLATAQKVGHHLWWCGPRCECDEYEHQGS